MARTPHPIAVSLPERPGLVWPCPIDPEGLFGPTPKQARGPRWRRCFYGYYLPTDLDPALEVEQRIVVAASQVLGVGAITGWAALRWRGVRWLDGPTVAVAVPRSNINSRPDLRVSSERLDPAEIELVDGIPLVSALRAVTFSARHAGSLGGAVNILDRAAAVDLASLAEVARYTEEHLMGTTGVAQLRRALALASENSWSPMETEMRLLWHSIGVTEVVCNIPIFDRDGHHLGTPDGLAPSIGLAGEYDGSAHLRGEQRARDIRREGAFRRVGLEYVEMVAADRRDPTDFLRRTTEAIDRLANRSTESARGWTVDPPPWWTRTETVDQRRALTPAQRERFLTWQLFPRAEKTETALPM